MVPWGDSNGDSVAIPPSLISMKYRLLHPSDSKGNVPWNRQRNKNCVLSRSTFIYGVYPGSLGASLTVTEAQYTMTDFSQ